MRATRYHRSFRWPSRENPFGFCFCCCSWWGIGGDPARVHARRQLFRHAKHFGTAWRRPIHPARQNPITLADCRGCGQQGGVHREPSGVGGVGNLHPSAPRPVWQEDFCAREIGVGGVRTSNISTLDRCGSQFFVPAKLKTFFTGPSD